MHFSPKKNDANAPLTAPRPRTAAQYLMLACWARVGTAAGVFSQGLVVEPGVQCLEGRAAQRDVHVSLAATVLVGAPIVSLVVSLVFFRACDANWCRRDICVWKRWCMLAE